MDSINAFLKTTEHTPVPTENHAPWLLVNGETTPDDRLKTLTPLWSSETWERYLSWFESQSDQRSESLLSPRRYHEACDLQKLSVFEFSEGSAEDELKLLVRTYLKTLTHQQRRVIEMLFWESMSAREIAKVLGIRHQSVLRLKKRALSHIRSLFKEGAASRNMKEQFFLITRAAELEDENSQLIKDPFAEAG